MNYRHIYHAGNFSDVFKHILLMTLIECLLRKDKPFCYLDTHAGIGIYDLQGACAQKTHEAKSGIFKLCKADGVPEIVQRYLKLVTVQLPMEENVLSHCAPTKKTTHKKIRFYPGSPLFVRKLLRAQDHMILTELHPKDALTLKELFAKDKQVAVHHVDGYQALKAFLPPKQKRGLVLIDPSFEAQDEFSRITAQLKMALQRWPAGIYAVWYPIKDLKEVNKFYSELVHSGITSILRCELHLPQLASKNFGACGMIVIHPPWQWKKEVEKILPWLCHALSAPETGKWVVDWLVDE